MLKFHRCYIQELQALETSLAWLEGTEEIVLITPDFVVQGETIFRV